MSTRGWTVAQLNDFFAEWAMHNITWDYVDPTPEATAGTNLGSVFRSNYGLPTDTSKPERRLRLTRLEPTTPRTGATPFTRCRRRSAGATTSSACSPTPGATAVTVTFRGVLQAAAHADFRWGLVATDAAVTKPRYSKIQSGTDGALTFCVNAGESLWLVVMATPSVQQQIYWDQLYPTVSALPVHDPGRQRAARRLPAERAKPVLGGRALVERRRLGRLRRQRGDRRVRRSAGRRAQRHGRRGRPHRRSRRRRSVARCRPGPSRASRSWAAA